MTDAAPTAQDIENAECRRSIAERQNRECADAQQLADEALGPGYTPWMKLSLIDSDHHRTGDTTPVAAAVKVYRGELRLSENSVFVSRTPSGQVRRGSSYEELFGDLLHEQHPTRRLEIGGQLVPAPRWTLVWSALEPYEPRTAEQLASARIKREAKVVEREAERNPLFAEMIRQEGYVTRKPRGKR